MKLVKVKREVIKNGEGSVGVDSIAYSLLYGYDSEDEANQHLRSLKELRFELKDEISIKYKPKYAIYREYRLRETVNYAR